MILNAIAAKLKRQARGDFKGRHFEAALIVQAVSWYLRYPLSYRDIEELFLERGLEVDHSTINRWVLAYAPLIERRLRAFRKPHCGSVRIDETYIKVRGQWRYLYRAIDKHGEPVDFLLTANRDLEAAKRFFRKMLQDQPLLSPTGSARMAPAPIRPPSLRRGRAGLLARTPTPLRHQAPAAGHRERPFPGEEDHAAGRRLPVLQHGAAHDPGLRGDAVAAQGLRLLRRLDRVRAEPAARTSASDFQRLTKSETEAGLAYPAAHARVCDRPNCHADGLPHLRCTASQDESKIQIAVAISTSVRPSNRSMTAPRVLQVIIGTAGVLHSPNLHCSGLNAACGIGLAGARNSNASRHSAFWALCRAL